MMIGERASALGAWIAVGALTALGLVELAAAEALPGLHPYPDDWPASATRISGALLILCGTAYQIRIAAIGLALHWLAATLFVASAVAADVSNPPAWVPLAQTLVFVAFAVWLWRRPQAFASAVLRMVFGAMLVLFGAIHLTHADLIAGLIPDFVPGAALWPWITGGVQVIAGVACLIGRGVSVAALTISLMYAAWLPIVHAPRLVESHQSVFEWTFALTALALAGVALAVTRTGVRSPPPGQQ